MTASAITSADGASAAGALSSKTVSSADGEQRFLKLLVTQLNNQDPLNPLDNAELTSQLAQMSTVSGIEKLNTAFQSLLAQSGSSQVLQSASLIGRAVLVPGNGLALEQGAAVPFAVELPQGADSVKVTVTDVAGNTVRNFDLGALPQGVKTLSWDGKSDGGVQLADGAYTVNVAAYAGDSRVTATALTYAGVASVSQGGNGVALDLGAGRKAALSEVRLIL
ncbi:MAG: flagellar hook assembly protein FlgD [Polaromonas sp.]|uniref:flagellar hook assembly protein FlgD n=1 Tax=Polaromonas sp. TaxID=1869339 RepID=UPI002487B882|nr:flagellar hook assembly protein FlgD [Polaromonas sp.]MDI1239456.1 flagellar hook assembly protein FlgD [Polaromonas sp.]MDI1338855.1 flagellar hook assembly protein FlgD [Polaromonas sp.]